MTSAASYEISSGSHGLMSFVAYLKTSTSLPLNFGSHLLAAVLYQDIGDQLISAFLRNSKYLKMVMMMCASFNFVHHTKKKKKQQIKS